MGTTCPLWSWRHDPIVKYSGSCCLASRWSVHFLREGTKWCTSMTDFEFAEHYTHLFKDKSHLLETSDKINAISPNATILDEGGCSLQWATALHFAEALDGDVDYRSVDSMSRGLCHVELKKSPTFKHWSFMVCRQMPGQTKRGQQNILSWVSWWRRWWVIKKPYTPTQSNRLNIERNYWLSIMNVSLIDLWVTGGQKRYEIREVGYTMFELFSTTDRGTVTMTAFECFSTTDSGQASPLPSSGQIQFFCFSPIKYRK